MMLAIERAARRPLAALSALTLLLAACAASSGTLGTLAPVPSEPVASIPIPSPEATPGSTSDTLPPVASGSPTGSPAATTTVRAYFRLDGAVDTQTGSTPTWLVPVLREVPRTTAVGTAALQQLIAGPNATERAAKPAITTLIPTGTRLLGLTVDQGVATVDLSQEFVGSGGWSSSNGSRSRISPYISGAVSQVVYTLTQFPTVTGVTFRIDGTPESVWSIDRPVTRRDFASNLPAIWVDRPAWGGVLGNPARIVGLADVFEAQFRVAIVGSTGLVLADKPVTASCGTGCLGTFDVTVPYSTTTDQLGTLRVYDLSEQDGSRQDVVDYPVWLTAG